MAFSIDADVMRVGPHWLLWLVVGALGGLLTVVAAVAARNAYHRRVRTSARRRQAQSARPELAPRTGPDKQPAHARTMPLGNTSATATTGPGGSAAGAATSTRLSPGSIVIGYVTVTTDPDPDEDRKSASALEAMCERCGWQLLEIIRDSDEGRSLERPGLRRALERILAGEATGLLMNTLERHSRSIVDLGALMEWFRDAGATVVVLDLDIDTSTPEGRHVANTLIALSARKHDRIAAGTRKGLAKGRASGQPAGRPAVSHRPELVERIAAMRAANMTLSAIAEQLNAEGVSTLRGGKKWRPSSIQAALGYQRPGSRDHLPSPRPRARP
jgi:DNA invertase Pin-like site-specific DNA recombinase